MVSSISGLNTARQRYRNCTHGPTFMFYFQKRRHSDACSRRRMLTRYQISPLISEVFRRPSGMIVVGEPLLYWSHLNLLRAISNQRCATEAVIKFWHSVPVLSTMAD